MPRRKHPVHIQFRELGEQPGYVILTHARLAFDIVLSVRHLREEISRLADCGWEKFELGVQKGNHECVIYDGNAVEDVLFENESMIDVSPQPRCTTMSC